MEDEGRHAAQVPVDQDEDDPSTPADLPPSAGSDGSRAHSVRFGEASPAESLSLSLEPEEASTLAVEPLPVPADQWEALDESLERELDAAGSSALDAARLQHQIAVVAETRGDEPYRAFFQLQRALELAPNDLTLVRAAQQAFRQRQDWTGLLRMFERELTQTSALAERARIWREMGQVHEDWLANDAAARVLYEKALAAEPGDSGVSQRMLGLLGRAADYRAQVELLRHVVAVSDDRRLRALRHAEMGALFESRLHDLSAATDSYEAAYAEDPANESVRSALARLYEQQQNWSALVELLVAEAERATGDQRTRHFSEAALLARERLQQEDRALQILVRVCEEDDSHPELLRLLAELLELTGQFDELADVYSRLTGQLEGEEAADIHFRLGVVLEERLARTEDALDHYRRAVDLAPRYAPAVAELERLCRRLEQWEELVLLKMQALADLSNPCDQATLLAQVGDICRRELGDAERAIRYHERALATSPHFAPSVLALEGLFLRERRYERLLELLEGEVQRADPRAALALCERMAWVAESLLGDGHRAVDYLRRALELHPGDEQLFRTLRRLLSDLGAHEQLVELTEKHAGEVADLEARAAWIEEAASMLEGKLGREEDALRLYAALVARQPSRWTALGALMRLYERFERWDELFELFERDEVSRSIPPPLFTSVQLHLAEIAERKLTQLDRAERHLLTVLERHRGHPLAVAALERIYRKAERWSDLGELLRAHVSSAPAAAQAAIGLKLGRLCEARLGLPGEATEWYGRAAAQAPERDDAREALLRRLIAEGRTDEAVRVLEAAIETHDDELARRSLTKRLADVWLHARGEPGRAAECLEQVLSARGAEDIETLGRLRELYRSTGDHERLVETLERLAATTEDLPERARLLEEAARTVELHLPDRDPAPMYEAVLQHRPHDRAVLSALIQSYSQRGDHVSLAHVLEVSLPLFAAADERGITLLRLALCRERAGDLAGGEKALAEAAALSGQWVAAAELRRVQHQLGGGRKLAQALQRLAALSRDTQNAATALHAAGQILAEDPETVDEALEALGRVLQLDPFHEPAARQQEQLIAGRQDWPALAAAIRARVAALQARGGASDPRNRSICAAALIRLARIERDRLRAPDSAIEALRRALELEPRNRDALLLLAELYGTVDRWVDAAAVYQRAVTASDDPAYIARAQFQLGRIWQERLGDPTLAISAFQNVLALNPQDKRAMRRLAQLFLASGDWENAADAVQRLLDMDGDSAARRRHLLTLADIYEQGFGDPTAAVGRLELAFDLDPTDEAVIDRLVQLNGRLGRWRAQCEVIQRYLEALPAELAAQGLRQRMRMAELLERQKQLAEALDQYAAIVAIDPAHLAARLARARLLAESARYEQAVQEYREILRIDPLNQLALAQLRAVWTQDGQRELAYAAAAVLVCCGMASESDRRVYRQHRRTTATGREAIEQEIFDSLIMHEGLPQPGRALLGALSGVAHRLRPAQLEQWQLNRGERLGQRSDDPLRDLVGQVARSLGLRDEVEVYLSPGRAREIDLILTDPPALAVGRGVLATLSSREVRFWIAELLAHVAAGTWVVYDGDERLLRDVVVAAWDVVSPATWLPGLEQTPETGELARQMRRSLSRRSRRVVEEAVNALAGAGEPLSFARWAHGLRCTALRAALWVVDDLSVALNYLRLRQTRLSDSGSPSELGQALRDHPEGRDLISFWLSERFNTARRSPRTTWR